MNVEANTTSLGMIISDSAGGMHSSSCCNMRIGYQPAIAKAMALKVAMNICSDLGLAQVIFEMTLKE